MALEIPTGTLEIPTAGVIPEEEAEVLDRSMFPEFEGLSDAEIISLVTQTITAPAPPAPAPPKSDDNFFPALAYGADTAQAAIGAGLKAVGQGLDIEGLEEYGRELQEKNLEEARQSAAAYNQVSLDDVEFGENVTDFVVQTIGETLPSMGIALGGAAVATIGAIPLGLTGAAAGAAAGAGAFLPSALMGAGETQIKMEDLLGGDRDYEDPSTAVLGGVLIGALDTAAAAIPFVRLLGGGFTSKAATDLMSKSGIPDEVLKGAKKTATDAMSDAKGDALRAEASVIAQARDLVRGKPQSKSKIRGAARGGAEQFALEGVTEGAQEAIGTLLAEGSTGVEDENFASSILEAAVKGGIAGFTPGAVVRGVKTESKAAQKERADKLQKFEEKLKVVSEEEGFDAGSANPADIEVMTEEEVIRFTDTDGEGRTRVRDISVADFETLEAEAIVESGGEVVSEEPVYSSTEVREIKAKYERTKKEQAKREALLNDPDAMAARAEETGETIESQINIIRTNYQNNINTLNELEQVVNSPEFLASEQTRKEKVKISGVQFKDTTDPEVAQILDGDKEAVDIGRQADIMGLVDRDGNSFSYAGEGPSTFLNEYSELQREITDLDLERLTIEQSGKPVEEGQLIRLVGNINQRKNKLREMEKIINTPKFQASLKANPDLQIQLDNTKLKRAAREEEFRRAALPAGVVNESDILFELTDLDGTPYRPEGPNSPTVRFQEDAAEVIEFIENTPELADATSVGSAPFLLQHLKKQVPFLRVNPLNRIELNPRRLETIFTETEEKLPPNVTDSAKENKATKSLEAEANGQGARKGGDPDSKTSNVRDNSSQGMLNRVNLYMKYMSSNKRLADRYPALRPIYNLVKQYNEEWFSVITRGLEGRTVAMALTPEKRKVYRIARNIADDMGIRIEFTGVSDVAGATTATIQIPGDTFQERQDYVQTVSPYANPYETRMGHLNVKNYIQDGEQTFEGGAITAENGVITINDQSVVNALQQEQETTDSMWDDVITTNIFRVKEELQKQQNKAREEGATQTDFSQTIISVENSILAQRGVDREALTIPEEHLLFLEALQKIRTDPKIIGMQDDNPMLPLISSVIETLEALTDGRRQGYFPRVRNGDVIIRVYKEVPEVDSKGEVQMVRRVVYRRDVHTPLFRDKIGYAKKKYESDLRNFYREGEEITFSLKNNENANIIDDRAGELDNMTILESILIHEASLNDEYTGRKVLFENDEGKTIDAAQYIRLLGEEYKKRKASAGFGKYRQHRKNIPGYITPDNETTYHDNAWAQYVTSLGRFVAKTRTNAEALNEIDKLKIKSDASNLEANRVFSATPAEVAQKMWENTISPQGAASALKSFAFYGFLGGNFSSSFLNLTQNFVTASLLYGAYGDLFQPKVSKATVAASALSIYYIKNNNAFLKKDRDAVARMLVKYKAAKNLDEGKDQFDKLYNLQARGSIGRINTDALSANADLTTDYWYDKLGLDFVEDNVEKGLDPKQIQRFKRFFRTGKILVDGVYSSTEITNRIAAALATYNTVKASPEGLGPLREFARNTASGVDNKDADRILDIEDAMQYIIDESQFNLSAFNRPRLAFAGKGLGAVALQFIPFVTMMLEVYANAITRYGGADYGSMRSGVLKLTPQGRRTLAFLILPQIILGGMFGLPFADDMKEVIKALVRSPVGTSLGLQQADMELAFYEIMTSTFGPEAMTLAEAIARGPIKAWGGIDIAQRVALSPFRSLIEGTTGEASTMSLLTGPAGAFFGTALGKSFDAFERGDYGKSLLRLIPLAMTQNIINAVEAGEDGVYTGKGRPLADGLGGHDLLLMTLGFSSENVYGPRNRLYIEKALATKSNVMKDKYLDKIIRLMVRKKNADSAEEKRELQDEMNKLYKEVRDHDRKQKNIYDKIDPNYNIRRTAVTRYIDQVSPAARYRGGREALAIRRSLDTYRDQR